MDNRCWSPMSRHQEPSQIDDTGIIHPTRRERRMNERRDEKKLRKENERLRAELHDVRAELARVRRNHLSRMAHVAWLRRDYPRSTPISFCRRGQYDRFAIACNSAALASNAKDAT